MLVIYNKGKVKIRKLGNVSNHECQNCGNVGIWDLRLFTKSFTLFFMSIHTYEKVRYVSCPHCDSYMELTKSEFNEIHKRLPNYKSNIINSLFWKTVKVIIIHWINMTGVQKMSDATNNSLELDKEKRVDEAKSRARASQVLAIT